MRRLQEKADKVDSFPQEAEGGIRQRELLRVEKQGSAGIRETQFQTFRREPVFLILAKIDRLVEEEEVEAGRRDPEPDDALRDELLPLELGKGKAAENARLEDFGLVSPQSIDEGQGRRVPSAQPCGP